MNQRTKADLEREMLATERRVAKVYRWVSRNQKPAHSPWTAAELQDLKLLYASDKTFEQIGRMIGRSRNSVAGAVKRMRDRGEL